MTNPIAYSPLYAWQKAHGARFADYGPWHLASVYSSVDKEQTAARTGLALADLSAVGKIRFQGRAVKDLLHSWFADTRPGCVFPVEEGKFGWACILSEDQCLLLSAQPARTKPMSEIAQKLPGFRPELVYEATSGLACLGVFGPEHGAILRQFTSLDFGGTGWPAASCVQTGFAGVPAVLVSVADSLNGTWILVAWDLAEYVWERMWQVGSRAGMIPLGMEGYFSARSASAREIRL